MKKLLILFCALFLIGSVFAEGSAIDGLFNAPEAGKTEYNNNIEGVPKSVKSLIGNEVVEVNVISENESRRIILFMKNAMIDSYSLEDSEEVTLVVNANEDAVNRILGSNERVTELKQALKDKEVTYKSKGFFKKLKFGFARFALNFIK
jgi:hypothetical protein